MLSAWWFGQWELCILLSRPIRKENRSHVTNETRVFESRDLTENRLNVTRGELSPMKLDQRNCWAIHNAGEKNKRIRQPSSRDRVCTTWLTLTETRGLKSRVIEWSELWSKRNKSGVVLRKVTPWTAAMWVCSINGKQTYKTVKFCGISGL